MPLHLVIVLCGVTAFGLAAWLEPWFQSWSGSRTESANVLHVALGDGRKLFSRHFYLKADNYLHGGYYPSIFDKRSQPCTETMPANASAQISGTPKRGDNHDDGHNDHHGSYDAVDNAPKDWIDRFGRHFYVSVHRHVGAGQEREILPWLRLSASLDPQRAETYTVASFWLRSKLGKANEAEQFLRDGLRACPGDPEILFELGCIYEENHHDPVRARNVWELALRNWEKLPPKQQEEGHLVHAQILAYLAHLEEQQKNPSKAIQHLEALHLVSPSKAAIQKWIDDLKRKQTGT